MCTKFPEVEENRLLRPSFFNNRIGTGRSFATTTLPSTLNLIKDHQGQLIKLE